MDQRQAEIDAIIKAMESLVERLCVISNRERVDCIIQYLAMKNTAPKVMKRKYG